MEEKISQEALVSFLKNSKKVRVCVVGDCMLDIFSYGKTERLSPEAPVPVIELQERNFLLGGAANVARNICSLGGKVTLLSRIGKDENAELFKKMLVKNMIQPLLLETSQCPTTVKERIIESGKHFVRIDIESKKNITKKEEDLMIAMFEQEIDSFDVVIFSDYAKGVITKRLVTRFCDIAEKKNVTVVVDTKPSNADLFKGKKITLFTPNTKEALGISGKRTVMQAAKFLKEYFKTAVLITQGSQGMSLYEDKKVFHVDAHSSVAVDVSGCGDTVIATLALALACKKSLYEAMVLANYAAGIVVKKKGTAVVTTKEFLGNC